MSISNLWKNRILAYLIDTLVLIMPFYLWFGNFAWWIVYFLYAAVLESSALQATIGKHVTGVWVESKTGERISFRSSMIRNTLKHLLSIFSLITLWFGNKEAEPIHDLVAESRVVLGKNGDVSFVKAWVDEFTRLIQLCSEKIRMYLEKKDSKLEELERLKSLLDKETITQEEFDRLKAKIID